MDDRGGARVPAQFVIAATPIEAVMSCPGKDAVRQVASSIPALLRTNNAIIPAPADERITAPAASLSP